MAAAGWRSDVLRQLRIPVSFPAAERLARPAWTGYLWSSAIRFFSSADDHRDKQEVIDRVLSVVGSNPGVESSKVTPDCHFQKDLSLHSQDVVEIVMALEEFKLGIPDLEAAKIDSCGIAIKYITSRLMAG